MASDYEHNSRCMPMSIWAMLLVFWCGLSHIGTLGFDQGLNHNTLCQDCCNHQHLGNPCNMQMSSKDNQSQCHTICQNQAVHLHHINMQAEFMQELIKADNGIEVGVETEIDTPQFASNFSKMRKCATTNDTHEADLTDDDEDDDDEDDDDFSIWSLPSACWSNAINCIHMSLSDMLICQSWQTLCICLCISILLDIVVLLAALEVGHRTSRTRYRQCRVFSLVQSAASKLLCRCALVFVLCASLKAKHMLPSVWPHQDEVQKPKPQYKETISINYQRYFGTEVKAYIPKDMQSIKILHTLGDGNCLWRAIARYTPPQMVHPEKKDIKHMKQKALVTQDSELVTRIATLAKTNAWGNQEAIMGICSYLDVNICVTTRSAVLHFGCAAGSATTFFVHLHDQHYSTVRRSDGERMYKHCCQGQCITLEDYHDLNIWSPEATRSTRTYGDKVCSKGSFAKRCNSKNFTTCKARARAPNYRRPVWTSSPCEGCTAHPGRMYEWTERAAGTPSQKGECSEGTPWTAS